MITNNRKTEGSCLVHERWIKITATKGLLGLRKRRFKPAQVPKSWITSTHYQEYAGEDTALQVNLGSASAQAAVEFFILAQDVIHRCSEVIILGGKKIGYHCTCQLFG
jgi:hypothetical protein